MLTTLQMLALAFSAAGGAVGAFAAQWFSMPRLRRTINEAVRKEREEERARIAAIEQKLFGHSRKWKLDNPDGDEP